METERLIIDPLLESDKEAYFYLIPHDREVLKTFMSKYAETPEEFDFSAYPGREDISAIRRKEDGRLIGIVDYFGVQDSACEIGYAIGSAYWGRGYATEAVRKYLEYLFTVKGIRTVYAAFFTGNEASRRVMEKCGMTYDHFSEKELSYLGRERDLIYYVIRRSE